MINERTWQTFLDDLCRRMKSEEKQTFSAAVGVSMTTINRWRRGEDWPKTRNLERLLTVLSAEQRQQLLFLMRRDPKVWVLLPMDVRATLPAETENEQVSLFQRGHLDDFCLKMLRLQRDTPDRFWQLSGAVLREALKQLETHPVQTGMEIIVTKCMPPRAGKVRSLRLLVGMGTSPWRGDLHTKDGFLGIESLVGYSLSRRHGEMVSDLTASSFHTPVQRIGQEQSAAAFPIMRENCIAGALLVSSVQADYFTPERMELIEIFADLIRLAFYDSEGEFYPQETLDLGLMPPWTIQREYFEAFRKRVEDEYRRVSNEETSSMRELMRVEEQVRTQIEDELLKIGGSEERVVI
jgi:transcriptional regulator with XRE-family HTH domain